uniref:amidohydrolase family protein n=1 Tax=Helicobacter rodentium TaxID=59617 RepID=UPI00262E6590
MQIIGADFVVLCDAEFRVLKRGGICFDSKEILAIDSYEGLCAQYKGVPSQYFESCAITPALANLHLHLEFSQNAGLLHFGNFGKWLDSVLENREVLMQENLEGISLKTAMQQGIQECLQSGVGFVGAVSSYGYDLKINLYKKDIENGVVRVNPSTVMDAMGMGEMMEAHNSNSMMSGM